MTTDIFTGSLSRFLLLVFSVFFHLQQADLLNEGLNPLGQSGYGYGEVYQYRYDADYENKKDGCRGIGYSKEGRDDVEAPPPY